MPRPSGSPARPDPDAVPLRSYATAVTRYVVVIAVCVLVGALAGAAIAVTRQPVFESRVSVLVPPIPVRVTSGADETEPRSVTPDTEAQLVRSEAVVRRLSGVLGIPEEGLQDAIEVTAPPNTQVLRIAFRATTPDEAVLGAETVAETYLVTRQVLLNEQRQEVIQATEARVQLLQQELDGLRTYAQALPTDAAERDVSRQRRVAIFTEIRDLQYRVYLLQSNAVEPGEVIRAATSPQGPIDQDRQVPVVSGALLGFLFAVVGTRAAAGRLVPVWSARTVRMAVGDVLVCAAGSRSSLKQLRPLVRRGGRVLLLTGVSSPVDGRTLGEVEDVLRGTRPDLVVRWVDEEEGRTVDAVRAAPLTGDTVLVVSDTLEHVLGHAAVTSLSAAVLVVRPMRASVARLRAAQRRLADVGVPVEAVMIQRGRGDTPRRVPQPDQEVLV